MGTVADKLQAVLNSKNAIKEKFGLPDDMPFSQYAENIKGGGGGEEINFYRCESVEFSSDEPPVMYDNWMALIFRCRGDVEQDELLYLTNPSASAQDRIWKNASGTKSVYKQNGVWVYNLEGYGSDVKDFETEDHPGLPFFPYYDELTGSGPFNFQLRLVWDNSDYGYYYRGYSIGSGNVYWENYGIKFIDGRWTFYHSSQGINIPTDSEMPFQKDGSAVVWPGSNLTASAENLIPGIWDWGMMSTGGNSTNDIVPATTLYRTSDDEFWSADQDSRGIYTYFTPFQADGGVGGGGAGGAYQVGISGLSFTMPDSSIPTQTYCYGKDENDNDIQLYMGELTFGGYRNPRKIYPVAKSVKAIQAGFDPVILYSDDGGKSFSGNGWSLENVKQDNGFWHWELTTNTSNPSVLTTDTSKLSCYYPNIDSSSSEYVYEYSSNGIKGAVILDMPFVEEQTVIVSGCSLEGVNGLYNRYVNENFPLAYFVRDNYDKKGTVYIVFKDSRWVFSGTPDGTSIIMRQHDKGVTLLSQSSPYLLSNESYPVNSYDIRGTTSAYVRYGAEGEQSDSNTGSAVWNGYQAVLEEGKYIFSSELTPLLPQEGFIPVPGNIYSENTKIQVEQLYGDDSGKFFLCNYVNRTYLSYNKIVVSGMPKAPFVGATYLDQSDWSNKDLPSDVANRNPNGTYILTNPDAEYVSNYIWKCEETDCVMMPNTMMGMGEFYIWPGQEYQNTSKYVYEKMDMYPSGDHYPAPSDYTSYVWQYYDGSSTTVLENGSVVVPIPEAVEPYWEGYKLYQVENGKWAISNELRRLSYTDYMPVAGRIYDSACTMEINNLDFTEGMKYSCPHNMSSDENDEWKLSVSDNVSVYNNNLLWYGFDNVRDTYFNASFSGESYLQWQNKIHPVLVKEIYVNPGGGSYGGYWGLQGSNDGEHWTTIIDIATDKWQWKNDGSWDTGDTKYKLTVPVNSAPYYYHRLIQTNGSWNIHYMEAFGFAVRQVPVFEGE